jgi:glycosyltransferase involved in cell wall biosynthesis
VKIDPAALPRHPNIRWLGQQPYDFLPYLIADWDICLMPFAMNESTRFISPTKTLEYLAAGKPIVSTPVRDVVDMFGDIVRVAADAAGFLQACRDILALDPAERRRAASVAETRARQHSWEGAASIAHQAIAEALRQKPNGLRHESLATLEGASPADDLPQVASAA